MQAGKCLELRISADFMSEDDFFAFTETLGSLGASLETDAKSGLSTHVAWFDVEPDEQLQRAEIAAAALLAKVPAKAVSFNSLAEQDWSTAWQKDWHGQPVGDSLWVRPSFCPAPADDRIDIVLDPGMAFGTGTHSTTRLCLQAIERICRDEKPDSILDMGAGSGLLAIAALKLGVTSALAIDIEEESVAACSENAAINGVSLVAELASTPPGGVFDLVVANILAGPLIDMAPALSTCVGRTLVLSGLLVSQAESVCKPYLDAGLQIQRSDSEGEWMAITLQR
ncbi:MAG TPA: 50S ribosomal protein L11 methyltransferase [Mariprofundaceae bacterium]|nr:50S ribosomal protein L11 methyltransferase [Mariprofundaceae bacterium]